MFPARVNVAHAPDAACQHACLKIKTQCSDVYKTAREGVWKAMGNCKEATWPRTKKRDADAAALLVTATLFQETVVSTLYTFPRPGE